MTVEILWNCVTTKDSSWRHQKETRLLALNNPRQPHLPVYNAEQRPRLELPQLLLKAKLIGVMVGPKADASVEAGLQAFLEGRDLAHVPITRSTASST